MNWARRALRLPMLKDLSLLKTFQCAKVKLPSCLAMGVWECNDHSCKSEQILYFITLSCHGSHHEAATIVWKKLYLPLWSQRRQSSERETSTLSHSVSWVCLINEAKDQTHYVDLNHREPPPKHDAIMALPLFDRFFNCQPVTARDWHTIETTPSWRSWIKIIHMILPNEKDMSMISQNLCRVRDYGTGNPGITNDMDSASTRRLDSNKWRHLVLRGTDLIRYNHCILT